VQGGTYDQNWEKGQTLSQQNPLIIPKKNELN